MLLCNNKNSLYFTFGRFQPITIAHEELFEFLCKESASNNADYSICISPTQDKIKNALSWEEKYSYITSAMPYLNVNNNKESRLDKIISNYTSQGYKNITMVVGNDRVNDFQWIYKYKDELNYSEFKIIEFGNRTNESVSATKARSAALSGDFKLFRKLVSVSFNDDTVNNIYSKIRERLNEI